MKVTASKQNTKLKILFLPAWFPTRDNPLNGVYVKELAKAVSLYNDVIVLFCEKAHQGAFSKKRPAVSDQIEDGIRTIRIKHRRHLMSKIRQLIELWHIFSAVRRLILEGWKPDILHVHVYLAGIPAIVLGRVYRIPVVITEHWSAFIQKALKKINIWEARFVMNRASIILPVSKALENAIISFGIKNRYKVVPNTLNTSIYLPPAMKETNRIKKKILTVALLTPVKGLNFLILALAELRHKRQDFVLDIVGDGPKRKDYEALTQEKGLNDIITFHGLKTKTEVAEFMCHCDFYVQTSLYETFGVTFIEAMACGKPIIATTLPALQEKIDPNKGILVPPKDVDSLTDALDDMLDRYQDYSSKDIARFAQDHFGYESVGVRLTAIYNAVLKKDFR